MDKQIHELTNTATDFAADDYIAVDNSTDQTRKMAQSVLKSKMRDFTLGDIHNLSTTAIEADLVSGNYLALDGSAGTKKLPAEDVAKRSVQDKNCGCITLSEKMALLQVARLQLTLFTTRTPRCIMAASSNSR